MLNDKLNLAVVAAPTVLKPEAELIDILKKDSPLKAKADACRELARVGSKDAVPVLAAMLGDDKLSHMARYGLETIPDPSVDDALRDALGQVKGKLLAGVIGSIGVRCDTKAIEALIKLLKSNNEDVAQAAARALGSIGTSTAAEAIIVALRKAPEANKLAFCEGLFRCAEELAAQGMNKRAQRIYNRIAAIKGPHQVRTGVKRGKAALAR